MRFQKQSSTNALSKGLTQVALWDKKSLTEEIGPFQINSIFIKSGT